MSTPEEQQRYAQQQYREQHQHQQQPQQPHQHQQQDPYGTQTWQSDTWDTSHQPVHPPLGAVPGQPAAPEGWFRDEASAPAAVDGGAGAPWPGGPAAAQQQAMAPEGWFRDENQQPAPAPAPAPGPAQDWSQGAGMPAAAAETAYLPPYPGPEPQQQAAASSSGRHAAAPAEGREPAVPEGWFRDEVPAPAAAQDWSQGAGMPAAAAETAYLPPYPGPAQHSAPAEETAYLPPVPAFEQQTPAPSRGRHSAAPAQPQAPVAASASASASAEETAYLPPYPGPAQQQSAVPEGWFRDEVPAAAPASAPAEETAYLPPYRPEAAAEQTAYLPPQAAGPAPEAAEAPETAVAAAGAGAPGAAAAEWSPPTLAGNTLRAVDPAQARAEGRSPIIDPGPQAAILTAGLGLLLAVAAALGPFALLVPLIVLQALTAAGWFRLNGMWPARQGIALAFAGALVADAAVLAVDDAYGPGAIVGTLGAWVLLTLVLQLRSHADPDERMYGLMASVASAALAIVCAGYLAADLAAVTVGAAAVAVAVFARALPLPTLPSVGVSLAAAAGAGIAVGGLTSVGVGGALLGLVAGVCALIGLRVAAYDYPSKFVHMTAGVALPLAAAAPAVYLIGRVVG
ncbi:hypothetical protein ACF059_31590 [Streptomyces sp. NPDC016562]|uniref:hypothetical protein n=1 Tax=Streptomyces sp. NPDC016562 TaxID=3364966 RepID=UPI0036FCCF4F